MDKISNVAPRKRILHFKRIKDFVKLHFSIDSENRLNRKER